MLFDTHTHINNENYTDVTRRELIKDIENSDVAYAMDIGFDLPSSERAVSNAKENPWCYAVVGVHPHDAKTMNEEVLGRIKTLAGEEKTMAIGEIGLDYHYDLSERDVQKYWFRQQIKLANELKMPIVIHSREADEDTMNILKEEGAFSKERQQWFPKRLGPSGEELPDSRVLIHCFSSSKEVARQYVNLGATLGICGPVTYKNNRKTVEVVENTPIEFLVVETDAPYLTPEPFRGRPNKSPYVEHTARRVAVIKSMTYEEVVLKTCENGKKFFDILD